MIGFLWLDEPLAYHQTYQRGSAFDPAVWSSPSVNVRVPGATLDRVLAGDRNLDNAFVAAAQELEDTGAALIVGNCGFMISYAKALANAVSIPVFSSSLLWLPLLGSLVGSGQQIGVLTFDAQHLDEQFLEAAGVRTDASIQIVGLDGLRSWHQIAESSHYDWRQIEEDSHAALSGLSTSITFLVVECTALSQFVADYSNKLAVRALDIVSLVSSAFGYTPCRPTTHSTTDERLIGDLNFIERPNTSSIVSVGHSKEDYSYD